ncbi:hypothetical protein QFC20_004430 [Naganishia adeliensis]|uniref:Uncharacterized protein n=1 Tax=Naganishia adeliensis TaxID=92952 RepID=A0ACC2W0Z1_9TREE|nr:hypothetical protein QFC20_004430 [Naganishia adeliensis]
MAFFTPNQTPALTHTWTEEDIELASTAAIHFIKAFYKSMDNVVERLPEGRKESADAVEQLLGRFYSDRSTLVWNGTKATGLMEIGDLVKDVPPSHNEVLSVDCHPISVQGSSTHVSPAQLSSQPLTTRLAKAFYTPTNEDHTYPDIPDAVRPEEVPEVPLRMGQSRDRRARGDSPPPLNNNSAAAAAVSQKDRDDLLPRMFHEVFVLANVEEVPTLSADGVPVPPVGGQQPQYTILSDTFRFVG